MRWLFSFLLLLASCGNISKETTYRIGVDPTWSPWNFGELQPFVNGYTEDLLLQISKITGIEFVKIPASWDNLEQGMREKRYDAMLTSLPPYVANQAKYQFSPNFLNLGPVLIVPSRAKETKLEQFSDRIVGVISNDPSILLTQQYPRMVVRTYISIPALLNSLEEGETEAVLLNQLPAAQYVHDLYAHSLKIASEPLTDAGLHLVAPKDSFEPLLRAFTKALEQLEKDHQIEKLQQKWALSSH